MLHSLEKPKQESLKLQPFLANYETFTLTADLRTEVEQQKYAITSGDTFHLSPEGQTALRELQKYWESLEYDPFYGEQESTSQRLRRYSDFDFTPQTGELRPRPHVPYLQSPEMNPYAGGKARHFGDILAETYKNPLFQDLVNYNFSLFPLESELVDRPWICQVHAIRIVVGIGRTTAITPEGIHSDGYPFAGLHLMNRVNVQGGETTIYQDDGTPLATTTFINPLDSLWLEDVKLKHSVTDMASVGGVSGHRDILAISFSLPDSIYAKRI